MRLLSQDAPSAPAVDRGNWLRVPAVNLYVPITAYNDCSGLLDLTHISAARYTCSPDAVLTLMGHNPGLFTPLLQVQVGALVIYHDAAGTRRFSISNISRVSRDDASAAGQDGSYPHAVMVACANSDGSLDWVFIATPIDGPGPAAPTTATSPPAGGTAPPGSDAGQANSPPPSPSPSPTPRPLVSIPHPPMV